MQPSEVTLPTKREVDTLEQSGTPVQVRTALQRAIEVKKSIEGQLAESKQQMLSRRTSFQQRGFDPRNAQMHASKETPWEWRQRATGTLRQADVAIMRLRARLNDLCGNTERREVWLLRGKPEDVVAHLDSVLTQGGKVYAMSQCGDAVIVVGVPPHTEED